MRMPRSHVAATNPARSVVAPPPTETMESLRVKPADEELGLDLSQHEESTYHIDEEFERMAQDLHLQHLLQNRVPAGATIH